MVGAFGLVLRTTDGGEHWQPWLHAVDNPEGLHLYAVRGIGGDVFIVGEQGLALQARPRRARFRALELPYKGTLFGVIGNAARRRRARPARHRAAQHRRRHAAGSRSRPGLQVGLTAGTVGDDGRFVLVSQAGHVLASRDDGASFTPVPSSSAPFPRPPWSAPARARWSSPARAAPSALPLP